MAEEGTVDQVNKGGGHGEQAEVEEAGEQAQEVVAMSGAEGRVFRLEFQMEGFVLEDAGGDGLEERLGGEFVYGGVIRNGEAFGTGKHAGHELEAGKGANAAEERIDPVVAEAGDLFLVEEAAEKGGVALFFADEELGGGGEARGVGVELGGAAEEARAIGT
ncbi:hypothetical protein WDZ92_50150, partial [Nostoc sp. NIES-2111]